ncbi:MAG: fibronectin type III domain-containing protein [Ignavibacteriae bacterium]|nr:fibronectin type III domain-containing protein [Ignavibacteriota bacterium]
MARRNIRRALQAALFLFGTSMAWSIDPPVLVSPTNGATGQPVLITLSWNAVAFADSYLVQVADDSLFETIIIARSVAHTAVALQSTQVGPLVGDSTYFWRIKTRESGTGTLSSWSTAWRFRTVAAKPGTPVLSAPVTNATGIALTDSVRWNADAIADAYRIEISTSTGFTAGTMIVDTIVAVQWGFTVQKLPVRNLVNKTKYYWRVQSRRGTDTSAWAAAWNFTTIVDTPGVPTQLTPASGAQSIAINTTSFTWSAVPDAASYRLQIATDAGFTSLVYNDSAITAATKAVPGLLFGSTYYWRLSAKNVAATSAFSGVRSFSTKLAPPGVTSPATGATNTPIIQVLDWDTVASASSYRLQVSTATSFSPLLYNVILTSDTLTLNGLANKTKYYWRVSARNASGDTSAYPTTPWNFTTIVDTPAVPVLSGPVNRATSQPVPPTLSWIAATDAANYRLQVATDSLFTIIAFDDSAVTGVSKSVTGLSYGAKYYWRVRSKNAATTSDYSGVWTFSTKPVAPSAVSPASGATGTATTPLLSWTPIAGATSYCGQVSTATGFSPLLLDATIPQDTLRLGPLANKTKYYWRVSARNTNGDTSAYPSTAWNFTTIVSGAGEPSLVVPLDGAKSIPPAAAAFSWVQVPDAATYRLQVSLDMAFGSTVFDDSTLTTSSKTVATLLTAKQYFWRVNAKNAASVSPWSEVRSFTTNLAQPSVSAPTNGATDQLVGPTLKWSASPTATSYLVQVSRTSALKILIVETTVSAESLQIAGLGNDSVYYWRVSARNSGGDSSVYPAAVWSFRTKIATPYLNQPLSNAPGQVLNPTLSWLASPAAAMYRLQVSEDPAFPGAVVFDDAAITGISRQIGPLGSARTYYWRVNARNATGTSTSLWSEVRAFTTRIDTPAVPVLITPASGALDQGFSPTMQWNPATGASFYGLQVALDSLFTRVVFERFPLVATSFQVGPLQSNTTFWWRVQATNSTGTASSAYSQPRWFKTMLEKPAVPTLYTPVSRSMAQTLIPVLRWSSFSSSEWYRLQLSTDSYFPTTLIDTTGLTDTVFAVTPQAGLGHNTAYYWRVKGVNRLDSSAFALPFNFTTVIATPTLTTPPNQASEYTPANVSFQWLPVSGARTYAYRLSMDSTMSTIVRSDSGLSGTSVLVDSLSVSTRYYWQVSARSDSNGVTVSPLWSFTTLITVPGVPLLTSPVAGALNQPTSMTFQWRPSLGANSYRLQISTDSAFGSVLYDFPALAATSHQVTSLAYNTTYFWRVNASNGNGPSAYSPVRRLTVTVPPPAVPSLTAPTDGQNDVGLPVLLSWGQTSGSTQFRVRISSTPDFSTVVYDSLALDNWVTVSSIPYGAKFYWQVTAINAGGAQSSAVWSFTTRINIPAVPVLVMPTNGTINTPITLALEWSGATGASRYHLQVARDSVFSILILSDSLLTAPLCTLSTLDNYSRFFWRVRAINAGGSSTFSQGWSFRTIIGTPVPVSPALAALHQPHATVFRWHRLPAPAGYRLQLSRLPDFSALELDAAGIADTVYQAPPMVGFTRYYWRVSARSIDGSSTSAYSGARYYTTVLDTPAILAPTPDIIEQPVTMHVRWRRVQYAETYRLELAKDEHFTTPAFVDSSSLDTVRTVGPLEGMTSYWWRLRAQNPADASEYTATRKFITTIATPVQHLPVNGELFAPLSPTLSWQDVPGAARYRVQVATDTLMTQIVLDDSLVATTSRSVGPLPRLMKHYWRVRAKSADGRSIGSYSPVWSFRTVPAPPSATTLVAPTSGLLDQSRTVPLKWRRASGADTYGLLVGTDSLFTQIVIDDTTITDTVYTPKPLEGLLRHYWRVRSINPGGTSAPTSYWHFTTIIATPLAVAPVNGVPDQPVNTRLVWSKVPRATTYRLQLSTDSLFRTAIFDDSTLVDTARMVSSLGRSTTYFWRIRARAAGGASTSSWSPAQRFITVPDPPALPVLTAPVVNAKNVPVSTTLSWQYAARAARYQVQLAADTAFEFIIRQDSTIADTLWALDSLDYYAVYYWRVKATNVGGTSAWTLRRQFLTTLATPVATAPAQDAINQPIQVALSWTSSKGATRYRLVLSSDSLLRAPLVDDSTITGPGKTVSGLAYTTSYFWRVVGRSADGACISQPSAIRKFTTIIEKPPVPQPVSPAHLAEGIPAGEALVWNTADRATRYHLQVSTDSQFIQLRLNDSTSTDTSRVASALLPHTTYWWKIRAGNLAGFSAFSTPRKYTTSIATPESVAPPDSATGVAASLTMRWTASPGAANYVLEISQDPSFGTFFFRDSAVTGVTRDVAGLEPFTNYYWRVKAVDARGAGAYSRTATFVTKLVAPLAPLQESPHSGAGLIAHRSNLPVASKPACRFISYADRNGLAVRFNRVRTDRDPGHQRDRLHPDIRHPLFLARARNQHRRRRDVLFRLDILHGGGPTGHAHVAHAGQRFVRTTAQCEVPLAGLTACPAVSSAGGDRCAVHHAHRERFDPDRHCHDSWAAPVYDDLLLARSCRQLGLVHTMVTGVEPDDHVAARRVRSVPEFPEPGESIHRDPLRYSRGGGGGPDAP